MRIVSAILIIMILLCSCTAANPAVEHSDTRLMMDTVCTITAGGEEAQAAVNAAFDIIAEIEEAVSYYSSSSEVSAINRAAAGESVDIGPHTREILKTALDVCEKSGGAFDITVATLKDLWDFSGGKHKPPTEAEILNSLTLVGYRQIKLSADGNSVVKSADGVKIDLGGAAKGYAADKAEDIMRENGAEYGLINLGGNVSVFGKNPKKEDGGWVVAIQKPFMKSGEYSQTVQLTEGAVVTSGNYQRYFEYEGVLYHHILDPSSGRPANSGISGASIVADSALTADCLATACMVLGEERGRRLAEKYKAELITEQ